MIFCYGVAKIPPFLLGVSRSFLIGVTSFSWGCCRSEGGWPGSRAFQKCELFGQRGSGGGVFWGCKKKPLKRQADSRPSSGRNYERNNSKFVQQQQYPYTNTCKNFGGPRFPISWDIRFWSRCDKPSRKSTFAEFWRRNGRSYENVMADTVLEHTVRYQALFTELEYLNPFSV
jgi:hypothetical protein